VAATVNLKMLLFFGLEAHIYQDNGQKLYHLVFFVGGLY
jgi:hypothetical protein